VPRFSRGADRVEDDRAFPQAADHSGRAAGGLIVIRKPVSDYPLVIIALCLSAYGIAVVYSAGQTDFPVAYIEGAWKRQLGWFVLSLVAGYAPFRASGGLRAQGN